MNSPTKILFFGIVFVSLITIVYANSYGFCSLISCTHDIECDDACDGSYWYYGNGRCSADCYFNCSKRCEYDNRICADSDKSDNFPKISCCVRTCNAECDQDSDCLCPEDECVDQDYYDYPEHGICDENCECYCEPNITENDPKCIESFIEANKTAEPKNLFCEGTTITLIVKGIGINTVGTNVTIVDFLPSHVNLQNLTSECDYDNETRKISCYLDSLSADEIKTIEFNLSLSQLGKVLVDVYPESGVSYINYLGNYTFVSFPETYVNVFGYPGAEEICNDTYDNDCDDLIDLNDSDCYQCEDNDGDGYYNYSIYCPEGDDCDDSNPNINPDAAEICDDGIDNNCNNKIDCNDPSCANHPACVKPSPTTGGGIIMGGAPIIKEVVCSDDSCDSGETCSSCPEDCLKEGEVCCDNITYTGNCCVDADCGEGYECNMTKYCHPLHVKEDVKEPEPEICEEDWICTEWSQCKDDVQMRRCVDKNNCGSILDKPLEVKECETVPVTGLFLESPSDWVFLIILIFLIFLILFFWRKRH